MASTKKPKARTAKNMEHDLLRRIADGLAVEPAYFREWRERRLVEALREVPEAEHE